MATIIRTDSSSHVVAEEFAEVKSGMGASDFLELTELLYFETAAETQNPLWIAVSKIVSVTPKVSVDVSPLAMNAPLVDVPPPTPDAIEQPDAPLLDEPL